MTQVYGYASEGHKPIQYKTERCAENEKTSIEKEKQKPLHVTWHARKLFIYDSKSKQMSFGDVCWMVGVFSSAFSQLLLFQLCIRRYEIELWQTWQPNCVTLCTLHAVKWLNSEKQLHGVYHFQFDYTTISKLPICLRCVIALKGWTRLAWCFGFVLTRSCLGFVIFFWLLLPHSSLTSSLILLYFSILLPHLSLIPLTLSLSRSSLTPLSLLPCYFLTPPTARLHSFYIVFIQPHLWSFVYLFLFLLALNCTAF